MKYTCLIIDDEPLAIEVIESHLEKLEMFEIAGKCSNAIEAFKILSAKKIDLLFLDIQLPGLKGTDFLKQLTEPPSVILTTAYRKYALESYELNVVDYLLKPISFARFIKAVNKFFKLEKTKSVDLSDNNQSQEINYIYVSVNKKVHKIYFDDIIYIESLRDYITIHLSGKKLVTKYAISAFKELLPPNNFLQIHRSFIISLKKVKGFTGNTIDLGGIELPIGRNYKKIAFQKLDYSSTN